MTTISRHLDRAAIALSGLCLVHCLLLPVVIALFPLLAIGLGSDGHFHELMLWLVLPISTLGLALGWRQHQQTGLALLGMVAMSVLAVAATWGHQHLAHPIEIALTVAASLVLAAVHLRNYRLMRSCSV